MLKKLHCEAPLFYLNITNYGEIRPCSAFRNNFGRIKNPIEQNKIQLLKDLENGTDNPGCFECKYRESLGLKTVKDLGRLAQGLQPAIMHLELNLSNTCNLKCRMCTSDSSTAWFKDDIALLQDPETKDFRLKTDSKRLKVFANHTELIEFFETLDLTKLESINFKGGEPLLQDEVFTILEYLIDKKINNRIVVKMTTNGTFFHRKMALLSKFKCADIFVSVDAVGQLFNFIRRGRKYSIPHIESNIILFKKIPNATVRTVACIGAMNIFQIAELFDWSTRICEPPEPERFMTDFWTSIYNPEYLSVRAIPIELRHLAVEHNFSYLKKNRSDSLFLMNIIESFVDLKSPTIDKLSKEFISFSRTLDRLRDENILDVVPEFKEWFNGPRLDLEI